MCARKFPRLVCRPIAAQLVDLGLIALFEFELSDNEMKVTAEKHYQLVSPDELSPDELDSYLTRPG